MKNKLYTKIIAVAAVVLGLASCANEPDRILFTGPHFISFSSPNNVVVLENSESPAEVGLYVSLAQTQDITISFEFEGIDAVEGVDFEVLTQSPVVIPAGEYSAKILVQPINNDIIEDFQRFVKFSITNISLPNLEVNVNRNGIVELVNEDCAPDVPKATLWYGGLFIEDDGYAVEPAVGRAGAGGTCGGQLIVEGDLLSFGIDSRITLVFEQDEFGSPTGSVKVNRASFFLVPLSRVYEYEAEGYYDEETREIVIDYIFWRDNAVWFPGTHIITKD